MSTREAVVAEEDSSFDVELLNAMRFEEDEKEAVSGRDRVTKAEHMGHSSSAVDRRRAAKKGKGKGRKEKRSPPRSFDPLLRLLT